MVKHTTLRRVKNHGKTTFDLVACQELTETSFCQISSQEPMSVHSDCSKDYLRKPLINIQKTHRISNSKQRVKVS